MIHTDRLLLRPVMVEDADSLLPLYQDEAFREHLGGFHSLDDARDHLASLQLTFAKCGYGLFTIVSQDRTVLGTAGVLHEGIDDDLIPGVQVALLAGHRRMGFGAEALRAVVRWYAETTGRRVLLATVKATNTASLAMLKSLGFSFWKDRDVIWGDEVQQVFRLEFD